MIRDLLNPAAGILDLREDAKGGVQVAGLSEVTTRSTNEVTACNDMFIWISNNFILRYLMEVISEIHHAY